MKVTVKTNTGLVITPTFEPVVGRAEELIKFYSNRYNTYQIEAYRIENSAGVVVASGGEF